LGEGSSGLGPMPSVTESFAERPQALRMIAKTQISTKLNKRMTLSKIYNL